MNFRKTVVWLLFLTFFVPIIWVLTSPVNLSVISTHPESLSIYSNGKKLPIIIQNVTTSPRNVDSLITIKNNGVSGNVLELALPVDPSGRRYTLADISILTGDWKSIYNGERIVTKDADASLAFTAPPYIQEIPFLGSPDSGNIIVKVDEKVHKLNLHRAEYTWAPYRILGPNRTVSAKVDSILKLKNISLDGHFKDILSTKINLGSGRLLYYDSNSAPSQKIEFSSIALLNIIFSSVFQLYITLFIVVILCSGFYFLNKGVMACFNISQTLPISIHIVMGISILALTSNSLYYFFSAEALIPALRLLVIFLVMLAVFTMFRRRVIKGDRFLKPLDFKLTPALIPALVAILIISLPISVSGSQFFGLFKTDSFFYTTTPISFQSNSLLQLHQSGSIIGFGMRSIDLVLISVLGNLTGLDSLKIVTALCLICVCVPVFSTFSLVKTLFKCEKIAIVTTWSVALSAPLSALFFENYFVQHIFIAVVYANILTGYYFFNAVDTNNLKLSSSIPYIITGAFSLLLYPYFVLFPVIIFLIILYKSLFRKNTIKLLSFMVLAILFLNFQLISILSFGAENQFVDSLNSIAENILFPYYKETKFLYFIYGIHPFHSDLAMLRDLRVESQSFLIFSIIERYLTFTKSTFTIVVPAILSVSYVIAIWTKKRAFFSNYTAVMPLALFGYILLMFLALRISGTYAYVKLAWTLACFLPLIVVPVISRLILDNTKRNFLIPNFILIVSLIAFMSMNTISKIVPTTLWLANPNGIVNAKNNLGIADDLISVRGLIEHQKKCSDNGNYIFKMDKISEPPTQFYQIMGAHTYALMQSNGYNCLNCTISPVLLDYRGFSDFRGEEPADTITFSFPIDDGKEERIIIENKCKTSPML